MKVSPIKFILVLLLDILVAVLILLIFAYSFLGRNRIMAIINPETLPLSPTESITNAVAIPQSADNENNISVQSEGSKFADKFSNAVVCTDNSYKSENISIELSTDIFTNEYTSFEYHIADIYISGTDCFKTFTIGHDYESSTAFNILDINNYTNAILSINGDACVWQSSGLIVRNGQKLKTSADSYTGNELVLTFDGEMKYSSAFPNYDSLIENTYQMWNFGPALLDENGHSYRPSRGDSYISKCHPRTAVGYFEPGHYCFVVVDGRLKGQDGCYLEDLGDLFETLGCKLAYNLDGGSSSMIAFDGKIMNSPSADIMSGGVRALSDTIYITEPNR